MFVWKYVCMCVCLCEHEYVLVFLWTWTCVYMDKGVCVRVGVSVDAQVLYVCVRGGQLTNSKRFSYA